MPLHQNRNSTQILQRSHVGTGTSKCGTSTKSPLVLKQHLGTGTTAPLYLTACGGTGTSQCGVGTNVYTAAPLHFRTTRGLPTASVIDNNDLQLSSGTKPLRKMCMGHRKTCTRIKIVEKVKNTYSTQN